jgi:hypothetical protein
MKSDGMFEGREPQLGATVLVAQPLLAVCLAPALQASLPAEFYSSHPVSRILANHLKAKDKRISTRHTLALLRTRGLSRSPLATSFLIATVADSEFDSTPCESSTSQFSNRNKTSTSANTCKEARNGQSPKQIPHLDSIGIRDDNRVAIALALIEAEAEAFDGAGAAGGFVDVDEDCVHLDVAFGYGEAGRHGVEETLHDALLLHADDGIVRAGHADVGDIGGAAREDVLVGGGDVGVRAEDDGNFSVEIPAHGLFFRCCFGVHIDEHHFDIARDFGELAVGGAERVVDGNHEGAALQVENGVADAFFRAAHEEAAAGRAIRKIRGTQQARFVREKIEDLFAVPDVIAAAQDFDAGGEKLFGEARSDAEAGSGIFAIGDAEVDLALLEDVVEAVVDDFAAGRADDVTDEEDFQFGGFLEPMWLFLHRRLLVTPKRDSSTAGRLVPLRGTERKRADPPLRMTIPTGGRKNGGVHFAVRARP